MGGYSPSHYNEQECQNCGKKFICEYTERYCEKCDGVV